MKKLEGIIPIVAMPFTDKGNVDEDSLRSLIRHLIKTNVNALTIFGLASEFYKLTDFEKERIMELFVEELKGHSVMSMISITDHSYEVAIKKAKKVEEMGADSIMLLPPFFLGPSEDAIITHIQKVVSSVSIPVVIQYAPAQTGVKIPVEVFLRLKNEYENISHIKVETQPPGRYLSNLLNGSNNKLGAFVGYAGIQMPDVLTRGASGIQPGCSFSEIYVRLYQCFKNNRMEEFHRLFNQFLPYISYWMQSVELIIKAEKIILAKRGIISSDYCRKPDYTMDPKELSMIDAFLDEFSKFFKGNFSESI